MGGTWLGITNSGKIAMVTNYRGPGEERATPKSRGTLVTNFLTTAEQPKNYCQALKPLNHLYSGYNLIVGSIDDGLHYQSNRVARAPERLLDGIYGLSNHLLDTAWPKVTFAKTAVSAALLAHQNNMPAQQINLTERLFQILHSQQKPSPDELPDTGISREKEYQLSSPFVSLAETKYGTRCSTVIMVSRTQSIQIIERNWNTAGSLISEKSHIVTSVFTRDAPSACQK